MSQAREAMMFARGAHLGQKHGDRPFWAHLRDVAENLFHWGYSSDDDLVCAAWLHDTIEDTPASYQDIREFFGEKVAELVWLVTDEMGRNRKERKEKTHKKIFSTKESTVLKFADFCANVTRAMESNADILQMYIEEWKENSNFFLDAMDRYDIPLKKVLHNLSEGIMSHVK